MGFFSSIGKAIADPGGLFSGDHGEQLYNPSSFGDLISPGGYLQSVLDPIGAGFANSSAAPSWLENVDTNMTNWGNSLGDFHKFEIGNWWDKLKNNPFQLVVGAGDPFSTKVWNKTLNKDWTPYVSSFGGATGESYQKAERQGIDTDAARGMGRVADTIAAYKAGGYLGGLFGAAGSAAGVGATAGQAIGGAAVGAGNAWANDGDVGKGALMGAAPAFLNGVTGGNTVGDSGEWDIYKQFYDNGGGSFTGLGDSAAVVAQANQAASPSWMQSMGQAIKNPAGYVGISNPMAQGLINSGLRGAVTGAFQGNAGLGALQGIAGNAVGQGLGSFGNEKSTLGVNNQKLGQNLAAGLMGLYGANQAKKTLDGQIGQLQSLFSQNSPYAQILEQQLARKDAAAGRRSQAGQRGVELQARLAALASGQAENLNSLFNQRDVYKQGQMKDMYALLRNTGILDKLGSTAQQYFQPAQRDPYQEYFSNGGV